MTRPIDLEMLEDSFGKEAAGEIVDLFVSNMAETLEKLQTALDARDNQAGAAAAHEITGTASSVGSDELAACARQLEVMLNTGLDPRAADVLAHLKQLFGEVKHYIDESRSN